MGVYAVCMYAYFKWALSYFRIVYVCMYVCILASHFLIFNKKVRSKYNLSKPQQTATAWHRTRGPMRREVSGESKLKTFLGLQITALLSYSHTDPCISSYLYMYVHMYVYMFTSIVYVS